MTCIQRLRGARDILAIAIDHAERAHEGTPDQQRGRREQAASAIGQAVSLLADAGALFAIEVFRRPS